jgi:phosphoribosylformylglycinamidine cyclo-ligase
MISVNPMNYKESGVDIKLETLGLDIFIDNIKQSLSHIKSGVGKVFDDIGYFANVINLTNDLSLVVSVDGVGTKVLIAQMMDKYDTIGIDCIAMNINDIICLGAKPISFLDYIALQSPRLELMEQLSRGLLEGARMANITIPGGETAQVRDLIKGVRDNFGFDMAGFGLGIINPNKIINGDNIEIGDSIIGIQSSGLHSNGYSLARKVLLDSNKYTVNSYIPELQMTLGEELLKPTIIYSPMTSEILHENIDVKAFINITGDGMMNMVRVKKNNIRFAIDYLPDPLPIFKLIQEEGSISDAVMYNTFNMNIGFVVIVDPSDEEKLGETIDRFGFKHWKIGRIEKADIKKVNIFPKRLIGYRRELNEWEDF